MSSKNNKKIKSKNIEFGTDISFAASEAYKHLRTNVFFSVTDDKKYHVVGVTSSNRGEGKSTTSMHLALSIAQSGHTVVLVEGDLRRPNIARKMHLNATPGLSNLLAGLSSFREVIQSTSFSDNLKVITAGDRTPNPAEWLGSQRMKKALEKLGDAYEYIILDLPPVNIVTDALIVAPYTDGIIMVVAKGVSRESDLNMALGQFALSDCKILGFVYTRSELRKKRSRYGYYNYYNKSYGYGNRKNATGPVSEVRVSNETDNTEM